MTPILAQRLGTDRSFERLYRKHAGDVYRYALVVLRNQADAEDVTQTTFMNAYRAMANGERPRSPQNWLIAIAHNVCRQRFRQSQRRPSEVTYEDELAESVVEEDAITADDIRRALGHLAFNQRSALVMRELEGRSYQEIADILDLSVSAVETLIFRARRALREQLEEGITCHEAELAISKQLDGRLSRNEKGALRAHLRECKDCAGFARSQRAQRGALKSLAAIPLPPSLVGLFGGGGGATAGATAGAGAAFGGGLAFKAAALGAGATAGATAGAGAAFGGGLAFKAAALGAGALVATGIGYEGVKQTWSTPASPKAAAPVKQHSTPAVSNALGVSPLVVPLAQEPRHDQKPYRKASVEARQQQRKERGHGALSAPGRLKKPKPVHKERSPLPPSRARGRDLKPVKPVRSQKPTTNPGRGSERRHTPAPPPAREPAPKPKAERKQHPAPAPKVKEEALLDGTHGKSGR